LFKKKPRRKGRAELNLVVCCRMGLLLGWAVVAFSLAASLTSLALSTLLLPVSSVSAAFFVAAFVIVSFALCFVSLVVSSFALCLVAMLSVAVHAWGIRIILFNPFADAVVLILVNFSVSVSVEFFENCCSDLLMFFFQSFVHGFAL